MTVCGNTDGATDIVEQARWLVEQRRSTNLYKHQPIIVSVSTNFKVRRSFRDSLIPLLYLYMYVQVLSLVLVLFLASPALMKDERFNDARSWREV
jgi:hypothetical protein